MTLPYKGSCRESTELLGSVILCVASKPEFAVAHSLQVPTEEMREMWTGDVKIGTLTGFLTMSDRSLFCALRESYSHTFSFSPANLLFFSFFRFCSCSKYSWQLFGGKVTDVSSSHSADTVTEALLKQEPWRVCLWFYTSSAINWDQNTQRDSVVGCNSFTGTNKEDPMKQAVHHKDPKHGGGFKKGTHAVNVFLQIEAGVVS